MSTNVIPDAFTLKRPAVVVDTVMLPTVRFVVDAVTNDE